MKTTKQRIVLTDYLSEANHVFQKKCHWYELDPVALFLKMDWTQYDERSQVINQVCSEVFDEIVVNKKSLICYWPLGDLSEGEWFELQQLFNDKNFELEIHKKENEYFESDGLNKIVSKKWKEFVLFLLEALLEDIAMNDQIDQIATLTNETGSIVLFRMEQNGGLRYSFASIDDFFDQVPCSVTEPTNSMNSLPLFNSFMDMLEDLLDDLDLGSYKTQFSDKQLEKTYYNRISRELKVKNLIENWLETYSLN